MAIFALFALCLVGFVLGTLYFALHRIGVV